MMKYLITALKDPKSYDWRHLRPWQRHSFVLAVAGAVYLLVGLAYVLIPIPADRLEGLRVLLNIAPIQAWGVCWASVGILALASTRWPPASKTWGYTLMTTMASLWGSAYLVGVLLLHAPFTGLISALVWALFGFIWWAVAGLANPDDVCPYPHHEERLEPEPGR